MKPFAAALILGAVMLAAPAFAQSTAAPAAGDAARGKTRFTQACAICHGAKSTPLGPALAGVYGRKAGAEPGFTYSKAMTASAISWDDAKLDAYLAAPAKVVPGGKMVINVAKLEDRADVIAYVKTLK